jgi:hypothetical protein
MRSPVANSFRESLEQRMFVARFRLDPRTRDLPACAIPNGGARSAFQGGILKAEGMSKGAPDWLLFEQSSSAALEWVPYVGLALEFKDPLHRRKPSPEQREWHRKLSARGWRVEVVYTMQEAWSALCAYLGIKE